MAGSLFNTAPAAANEALQCPQVKGIEMSVADINKQEIVKDNGRSANDLSLIHI